MVLIPEESRALTARIAAEEELLWVNPARTGTALPELTMADIRDAEARLARFAPLIARCFPETQASGGIIESALTPLPGLKEAYARLWGCPITGGLYLKQDSHLPIAGSVKARGGIYEVLHHAETLALAEGILHPGDDYACLADHRDFFARYTVQVGSTGNLGMSIGIMAAALGFTAIVHMSADARQWKKDKLRQHGVTVIEYADDYSAAVAAGRAASDWDPMSYFVDDERSLNLFLGYSVAALRLKAQLDAADIPVDEDHPLVVYVPCGVGGAPGGVAFGLNQVFGAAAHVFFAETTPCPDMLLGMATGLNDGIAVQDIGLSGLTAADGLACPRPSALTGRLMKPILSGVFTVKDAFLFDGMRALENADGIFIEPSSCAALAGPLRLTGTPEGQAYLADTGLGGKLSQATHILWATGGALVPEAIRAEYRAQGL